MATFRLPVYRAVCLVALIVLAGCVPAKAAAETSPSAAVEPVETLHVWSADPAYRDEVLDGCRYWSVVGVACVLVAEREKADVRFHVRDFPDGLSTKCVKVARALAHVNGTVEVDLSLFKDGKGIDRKKLVATIAHETGHELGLDHVPLSCDPPSPTTAVVDDECDEYDPGPTTLPDGSVVCGPAIMNATRPKDFVALTPKDILGFRIRDPKWRKTDPPRVP